MAVPFSRRPPGRSARGVTVGASALGVSALMIFGSIVPAAADADELSEADSRFVTVSGVDLSAPEFANTYSAAPGGPATATSIFDSSVFDALGDRVALLQGGHGRVPLVHDGSAGLLAVNQNDIVGFSTSPNLITSIAANGAVDPTTGDFTDSSSGGSVVNLDAAFDALHVEPLTRHVLSQIDLQVGTVASRAVADAYSGASGDYRLDGLRLQLTSPLLTELPSLIDGTLNAATFVIREALAAALPGGQLSLPAGTIPDVPVGVGTLVVDGATLTVNAPDFDDVVSEVMADGVVVVSDDGVATVDLNTGEISIDLAPLFGGSVDGLPANTDVFTTDNMGAISNAVADALSKTTPLFAGGVVSALHATPLGMSLDASFVMAPNSVTPNLNGLTVATGTLSGSGSLDDFANGDSVFTSSFVQAPGLPACARALVLGFCPAPTATVVGGAILAINAGVPTLAPEAIAALAGPLLAGLEEAEDAVIAQLDTAIAGVYQRITKAFKGLMPALARVVINEQSTGDLGGDSLSARAAGDAFSVQALGVTMMPTFSGSSQAHIGLAISTVRAVADPAVDIVEPETKAGGTVTIEGTGWNPAGGPVVLVFTDADGDPVGEPVEAEVAPDGTIIVTWDVPEGTADGELTLTATQGDLSRTDVVTVDNPVIPPTPEPTPTPDPEPTPDPQPTNPADNTGGLATTGTGLPLLLGGAVLALLIGGTFLASRTRRS